tara:strand:+ start:320144 stop:320329 length:186 start_codon:yes stop_codon:yes gene_type:complete
VKLDIMMKRDSSLRYAALRMTIPCLSEGGTTEECTVGRKKDSSLRYAAFRMTVGFVALRSE